MKSTIKTVFFVLGLFLKSVWAQPIPVAFMASLSNPTSDISLTDFNLEKGVKVFFAVFPEAKSELSVVTYDNQGEVKKTVELAELILSSKAKILIGLSKSNQALSLIPVLDNQEIIFITPMATHDEITLGHPHFFRTTFSDSSQAKSLASFSIEKFSPKKVMICTNLDTAHSVGLSAAFKAALSAQTQVSEVKYLGGALDKKNLLDQIKAFKPNLIFIPDYVNTATEIVRLAYAENNQIVFLGSDGWGGREVLEAKLSSLPELKAYYATHWAQEIETPTNKKFKKGWKQLYPEEPYSLGAAMMFDALKVTREVLTKLKKANLNANEIQKVLLSTAFETTTGPIVYKDAKNPSPDRQVVILKFLGGKHSYVK